MATRETHRNDLHDREAYDSGSNGRLDGSSGLGDPDRRAETPPSAREESSSLGELIRKLGADSSRLLRDEVELVKAEMREKLQVYQRNLTKLAIGGVLMLGALFVVLVAVNRGLTAALVQFMELELAIWIAPLILAAVLVVVGRSMMKSAQSAMKDEGVVPEQTARTLREEKDWATEQVKEVRRG